MYSSPIITNDRQAKEINGLIAQIGEALSSQQVLRSIVEGLPSEVIDGVRRSLNTEKRELLELLSAYESAKNGNFELLKKRAGNDLGAILVVGRMVKGWSQKELAWKLGLHEQAIQRYEVERYRSISLGGLLRVSRALEVHLSAELPTTLNGTWTPKYEISLVEAQKILKHARAHGWLENAIGSDENAISQLKRHIAEHVGEHGVPSLLRTGLNIQDHSGDWALLSWKAQVTRLAKVIISKSKIKYRSLEVRWLMDLVRLSKSDNGPALARELLRERGIVLVAEPQISGMRVDGAAFLVDNVPVIGITLLRDSLDNFWFTLLHEVAHVVLHYRTGLASGFFDEIENPHVDDFEMEANKFAGNLLIPEELWARSPARIAKTAEPIERLAEQLGINPAIIFGRIRMERNNYALFSNKIGRGRVRNQLLAHHQKVSNGPAI